MDFNFAWLVELLNSLDSSRVKKALPASRSSNPDHHIVTQWFDQYGYKIVRQGKSGYSILTCLFPERLPERSYNIQEKRLAAIFGRALGLGSTRARTLNAWRDGGLDFASCVEAVMAECESDPPSPARQVTLAEIDTALSQMAANSPFSSLRLRRHADNRTPDQLLAPILRRLLSQEAKWLVRMILKSYAPVQIPEQFTMLQFHFLLPSILAIQDSFGAAIQFLSQPSVVSLPPNPERHLARALCKTVTKDLLPRLGTVIQRPRYDKARSIKHCCDMANKRLMSVERKYDGEYCQIHIDRSREGDCVQIFSKSGKDSTEDRVRLHGAIMESLSLHRVGCKIKQKCVLEGELLVYNTTTANIEPFHKIRRHVMHGRRFLGVQADSQAASDEQLMIVFFDVLLLDDKIIANKEHDIRRQHLKGLVRKIAGLAEICERDLINFGSRRAPEQLREAFARSITLGWEGFVLKGCNDPYFSLHSSPRIIKLKKDYVSALGDTADLCIVGGRRDARLAQEFALDDVSWSILHLACLENKPEVVRFGGKPRFKIIDTIDPHGIPRNELLDLNTRGQFMKLDFASDLPELAVEIITAQRAPPTELFKQPIVVEVVGAGFDKNSGCDFFTLRFPRLTRIHLDRTFVETMAFAELQDMAKATLDRPQDADSQADAQWIARLMAAEGKNRYKIDNSQSTSPGKSPLSAAGISLSPAARRSRPAVTVHTDNSELSQSENGPRLYSGGTSLPTSPTPAAVSMNGLKRKISDVAATATPDMPAGDRKGKKPKLLTGSDCPSAVAFAQSMPAGSPPISVASQTSIQKREPLVEMTSMSPQLNRRAAAPTVAGFNVLSSSISNIQNKGSKSPSKAVTAKAKIKAVHPTATSFLPTPPTGSEKSGLGEMSRFSAPKSACRAPQNTTAKSDCFSVSCAQGSIAEVLPQSTVLLGRSIEMDDRKENDTQKYQSGPTAV